MSRRSFAHTRAALVEYGRTQAARNALWDRVHSETELLEAEAADQRALALVQDAFHRDTADINSRDHCRHADLSFMRRMAREGDQQ